MGEDRFREAWSSLQYSRKVNDRFRWEAAPLVVSWKQLGAEGSLGWSHSWYLQTTAFFTLERYTRVHLSRVHRILKS